MPSLLKGNETPLDIAHLAINEFRKTFQPAERITYEIIYPDGIPLLKLTARVKNDLGEFSSSYRLDKMLVRLYPVCETIHDEFVAKGLVPDDDRKSSIDSLALMAMHLLLIRLVLLQLVMFEENAEENKFLVEAGYYYALFKATRDKDNLDRLFNSHIRSLLSTTVESLAKGKRARLAEVLNRIEFFSIPISAGRPLGSKKPEEKKTQERLEFESKIEQTVKALFNSLHRIPFKYEVAEALGIGGRSAKGSDSRINSFNNKLARLNIDYSAIITRLNLHE